MGIRDHAVYEITYQFRQQIRESDGGGGSDFVGWAKELTTSKAFVLALDMPIAEAWVHRRHQHTQDYKHIGTTRLFTLDAAIIEQVW